MLVGLEMDAKRMNVVSFAAGIVTGMLYFGGLWWNARLFTGGGSTRTMILVMIGRFTLMGGLLTMASLQGAMPLLTMALGVFVARFFVMREARIA
jgi:F1F0 ATPase subunit 2